MGKQFQIYLTPTDITTLIETLRLKMGLLLINPRSSSNTPCELDSPFRINRDGTSILDSLLISDHSMKMEMYHVVKQGYWIIQTQFSEVVELSGCYFDKKLLVRGRIFYDAGFYKDGGWCDKSSEFLKWSASLFRETKKILTYHRDLDAYVGDEAQKWYDAGGNFASMITENGPLLVEPMDTH